MKSLVLRFTFLVLLLVSSASLYAEEPWFSQNSGVSSNLKSVFFANKLVGYAVGEGGVILKTSNGGSVWNEQNSGTTETLNSVVFVSVSLGWACGNNNVIRKTTNGGTTWVNSNNGIPSNNTFNGIVFTDNSYGYVVGQYVGDVTKAVIYRSVDGGASWTQDIFTDFVQYFTSVHFVNPVNGWVTANNGKVLHTTDGGLNWINQGTVGNRNVFFTDDSVGWVCEDGYNISRTTDGGTTWSSRYAAQLSPLYDVYFINRTEGWAVGSPSDTVVKTTNGGMTWKSLPTKTSGRVFNSVFFVNSDTGWIVGSGGTILKTTIGGEVPTDVKEFENIPMKTQLYQNYPNPFNPSTDFRFRISAPEAHPLLAEDFGFVSLKVFNVLGKEVATLVNEVKAPGEYKVEWDASGFPSGIYFYKLQAGLIVEVKKMLLCK